MRINYSTLLKNTLVLVFSIALFFVVLEGAVRAGAGLLDASPYVAYDEVLGFAPRPNAVKRHKTSDFEATYHINQLGFRGKAYGKQKHDGTFRIVVLGDSFGFGWGVADDAVISAVLDRNLPRVEVINLSLSGYGTDQQYLRLEKEGFSYDPDLVVIQISPNDFTEIMRPFIYQRAKPYFLSENGKLVLKNVPVRSNSAVAEQYYAGSLPLPFRSWHAVPSARRTKLKSTVPAGIQLEFS